MSKKINWKKVRKRESFFLKHDRFPSKKEMASTKNKPVLMFGFNSVSR